MTPEEYQRLKEAEKEHLRKLRGLKGQLQDARRVQGIHGALNEMQSALQNEEFESSLRAIQEENAITEARMEVAFENADIREAEEQLRLEQAKLEAERTKQAAADLVAQIKSELNTPKDDTPASQPSARSSADDDAGPKTIGRRIQRPE